jgi:hypothetical protein
MDNPTGNFGLEDRTLGWLKNKWKVGLGLTELSNVQSM